MSAFGEKFEIITNSIYTFRCENEANLIKSLKDLSYTKNSKVNTAVPDLQNFKGAQQNDSITKLLNTECVIMPVPSTDDNHRKIWPLALVYADHKCKAEIGNIEAIGSLWKIIPRKDTFPGYRVILQTGEIGAENTQYLGKDLSLVSLKGDAAIWNIKTPPPATKKANNSSANSDSASDSWGNSEKIGMLVQFEFVETVAAANTTTRDTTQASNNTPAKPTVQTPATASTASAPQSSSLLICSSNEVLGTSELILCPVDKDKDPPSSIIDEQGLRHHRCFVWEIVPDHWIDSDMDFINGYV